MSILKPVLLITPVLLILAMGIILFVVLYQRRMLQHQEHVRDLLDIKQRQLLKATIQAEEEERRRIARDLHDEVGAMLSLVKLNLSQLTRQQELELPAVVAVGQKAKEQLDEVISSVRRIAHDLMPVVLEKMGLPIAIEGMKHALPYESGIKMDVTYNDKKRRVEPKLELLLYRIVQELFNNTLKHAKASRISINLIFEEDKVKLIYTDNGVGFNYEALLQDKTMADGLGLVNIQSRIALLNGSVDFQSNEGAGTKAVFIINIS
ncbi:sensor histidine kinase [Pontibacter silvestris]|uniref:histidine kinase n=1 Tax=Pontibacter silvestris TaxID=2305183 RepID=A0ABW4X037_9BACT|nr:histidine kinase [Pontibacter silvestris]MCC9135451.1 histidine kinase [Pontibacter silvestris]